MNNRPDLTNDFLRAYLECALWLGTDESDDDAGRPLDENYSISDFHPSSVQQAAKECAAFERDNAGALEDFYAVWPKSPDGDSAKAFAGHNFWLSRNGHGTGFWDRGAGATGDALHKAAEDCGERYVYVGDDGALYIG